MHSGRDLMRSQVEQVPANSPLIDFALRGLDRCWLPDLGRWSHIYHLDGRAQPNDSIPASDVFYTINVLLGMARVGRLPPHVDVPKIFLRNVAQLPTLPVNKYAFGVTLWASAELGLPIPDALMQYVETVIRDQTKWKAFRAQDLGMILVGVAAQCKADQQKWAPLAADMFDFLRDRYPASSGLFYDAATGFRRRYASFATQTYLTLACYAFGELTGDDAAVQMANRCSRKLI